MRRSWRAQRHERDVGEDFHLIGPQPFEDDAGGGLGLRRPLVPGRSASTERISPSGLERYLSTT